MHTCVCVVAISNARLRTVIVEWKPELFGCEGAPVDSPSCDGTWIPLASEADSHLYTEAAGGGKTTNDSSIAFPDWLASDGMGPPRGRGGTPGTWDFCLGNTTNEWSIRVEFKTLLAPWTEEPWIPAWYSANIMQTQCLNFQFLQHFLHEIIN